MDVRCENCATEYELDESKLRPGGVTVQCTHCGHIFKVRGRSVTTVGLASQSSTRLPAPKRADTLPDPLPPVGAMGSDEPRLPASAPGGPGGHGIDDGVVQDPLSFSPSGPRSGGRSRERNWLIRMPNGETETCRELATLQQWIVSGKVTRQSGISRTGTTWKQLGDIKELESFFEIADEARRALAASAEGRRQSQPAVPQVFVETLKGVGSSGPIVPTAASTMIGMPAAAELIPPGPSNPSGSTAVPRAASSGGAASAGNKSGPAARAPSAGSTSEAAPRAVSAASAADKSGPLARAASAAGSREAAPRAASAGSKSGPVASPPGRSAGAPASSGGGARPAGPSAADSWSGAPVTGKDAEDAWQGRVGALSRDAMAGDVAFAGAKIRPMADDFGRPGGPVKEPVKQFPGQSAGQPGQRLGQLDADADEDAEPDTGGGAGRWIVLGSLLLMAGAAAAVYWLVFRERTDELVVQVPADAAAAILGDAGPTLADAATAPPPPDVGTGQSELMDEVDERLAADTRAGLTAMDTELGRAAEAAEAGQAGATPGDTGAVAPDLALLLARARVHTALAQQLFDEAAILRDKNGEQAARGVRRQAEERVLQALTLVQKALKADRNNPAALVAMANIVRLQGKPVRQVDSYLDQALAKEPGSREARLVRAMAYAADKDKDRTADVRKLLTELASVRDDVRPLYRLALLELAARRYDEARKRADEVLAVQPQHEGALALVGRIREAMAVDTSDPMPPEEGSGGSGGSGGGGSGQGGDESYESLLAQAQSKVKAGSCQAAMPLFERAIDENPIGVEALVGMGNCHIELREFASAHGKFQAALGVSSRNHEALWGMGEAYRKQGLEAQAVQWYQRYVDEHPNGSHAAAARKHLDKLGGGSGTTPDPGEPTPPANPDTPPANPDTPPSDSPTPDPGN